MLLAENEHAYPTLSSFAELRISRGVRGITPTLEGHQKDSPIGIKLKSINTK